MLKELLGEFPNLVMTTDLSCSTALHTAAAQGHIDVVNFLLEIDSNLAKIARNNGKTVLHSAARMGHLEVVKALVSKDPSTGFRTDKKGQTALHMAVKGQNEDIVLELIRPDPSVLKLEDNKGHTALHIAIKKGRTQVLTCFFFICMNFSFLRHMLLYMKYTKVLKRDLYYEIELNGGIALKLKILVGISMSVNWLTLFS